MTLIILILLIKLLSIDCKTENSTFYLTYNTLNVTETITLDNLIILNEQLKTQAESLRHINTTNFFQDTLYLQIIKDHKIIRQKCINLGIKVNTVAKRSTLINLGILSEYIGLASTDTTNDLAKRINNIENEINTQNSNTHEILNNFAKQLIIIERWTELERENQLNSAKTTFLYLKLSHISSHLKDIITDLEIAKIAWSINLPSNIIFNLNILTNKLDNINREIEFPLVQANNYTLLSRIKNSISFKIKNNILYQSVSIPLIKRNDICTSNNEYGSLNCIGYSTTLNLSDCTLLEHNKYICAQRPCMVLENAKINCTRLTDTTYISDTRSTPCAISVGNKHKNLILNKKQVIYLDLNAKLNCNNIRIPTLTTTSENAGNHFLFDLNDNLLSKLNLTLPVDHKLYNDLKIFHTLNSENKKILNNKECLNSHFYITLSNSLVTGILLTGLAIGILTYLYRERNKARVNN